MNIIDTIALRVTKRSPKSIDKLVERMRGEWSVPNHPYYVDAETEAWQEPFWAENSHFLRLFKQLDHTRIIELACGHGRHSWRMRHWPNEKILIDFVEENIAFCRARFEGYKNFRFIQNNGLDLLGIADGSVTSLFCYDAMVHFHQEIVGGYLADITRVLCQGGMALLHHSNYTGNKTRHYLFNPHSRAFMDCELFDQYAKDADLTKVERVFLDWDAEKNLDALTLLKKG